MTVFFVSVVSWGKKGWKWLWGKKTKERKETLKADAKWGGGGKEEGKKRSYRKRLVRRSQKAVGGWLRVGMCTHLWVLLVLLVKWQPSFYVTSINRKIKSGRGNFGAVAISSLVVFYLQICIKMVVKKLELSCSLLLWNLHLFPLMDWWCSSGLYARKCTPSQLR